MQNGSAFRLTLSEQLFGGTEQTSSEDDDTGRPVSSLDILRLGQLDQLFGIS